jgi:hypothetical protein
MVEIIQQNVDAIIMSEANFNLNGSVNKHIPIPGPTISP